MCLIAFHLDPTGSTPLLVAANRDEYLARATLPAHWWPDLPTVFAGRDATAGGTWFAVDIRGRMAALTNVAEGVAAPAGAASRGHLIAPLLDVRVPLREAMDSAASASLALAGLNLIAFDWSEPGRRSIEGFFVSNRGHDSGTVQLLTPGTHAVSNGAFDKAWPKTAQLATRVDESLTLSASEQRRALLTALSETKLPEPALLDTAGAVPAAAHSTAFLRMTLGSGHYGTRSSALLRLGGAGDLDFSEVQWRTDTDTPIPESTRSFRACG